MTSILPIKSSSRAGRFKKKLVTEEELLTEAPTIMAKLIPFQELLSTARMTEAEFTACYIILYLSNRYPGTWLGSKKELKKVPGISWKNLPFKFEANILKRLDGIESIQEIFIGFALKSTPLAVNRAILEWSAGNYGLELMFRIPQPHEVLKQQKMGRRCVTAILDHRLSKYILGERDPLSFTMHDLIHADHFYFNNSCYEGQLGFYGLLDQTIGHFDLTHEKFAGEFEYLISDMNAYAIHLMKCLKSAMIHYFHEDYFQKWLMDLEAPSALNALNSSDYIPEKMDSEILLWLNQFRQS